MSRSILNDLQMVDDIDEPDLDAIGDGKESGGSVPTITNKEIGPKETSQTTTSAKTMGQSESVKMQRKRMAPRSKVWTEGHFIPIKDNNDIIIKGKCTYCGKELAADTSSNGTTGLRNHFRSCKQNPNNMDKSQPQLVGITEGEGEGGASESTLTAWRFDQETVRAAVSYHLIVDELPFKHVEKEGFKRLMQVACPKFQLPSRFTFARDCIRLYDNEKIKLKAILRKNCERVCLTTDSWTSNQRLNYMCVTAHFIDKNWKLHKKILNFRTITSHKGKDIGEMVECCLKEWGLSKVMTLTVDNASSNDTAAAYLRDRCTSWKTNVLNGKFIHMRCIAHIINLVVNDGLKLIEKSVETIRRAVKYAKQSPARLKSFRDCIDYCGLEDKKGLSLDCPTRWNSTYLMLSSALKYKEAFDRFGFEDRGFEKEMGGKNIPTDSDWNRAKLFVRFLEHFYNLTIRISGSSYVTSNNAFHEISDTYIMLGEWERSNDRELQKMAKAMKRKYDKYWGNVTKMNMLLYIPLVLDPRYKLSFVQFSLEQMYGLGEIQVEDPLEGMEVDLHFDIDNEERDLEYQSINTTTTGMEIADGVKRAMEDLFNEYKRKFSNQDNGKSSLSNMSSQCSIAMESQHTNRLAVLADKFKKQRIGGVFGDKSELDKYLNEDVEEVDDTFDILGWWKVNSARFPILARIARDVLAIPISTVASESAFSTGGRILDAFRSSLSPNMVETLICAQDWIKMKNRINVEEDNDFADKLESAMPKLSLATNDVNVFGTSVLNSCT